MLKMETQNEKATPLHDSGIPIEQISQALANFIMEEMPDVKERLYALMNLEQTMLWVYNYRAKEQRKTEAEERSV
jgi:hypothetical protein